MEVNSPPVFGYDFVTDTTTWNDDMSNKLFCTFTTEEHLDELVSTISRRYTILYNKIFVLHAKSNDEYVCTYNVDFNNVANFLDNTILVHRKKESNTLYTINALNTLIKELNDGYLDPSYKVDWNDYRNCILLTRGNELKRINTRLHKIVEL
jgi:hypothetical protein